MTMILYTGQYNETATYRSVLLSLPDRDLKPENILYRTKDLKSDIVIADFGM
jgi:hypothetical protein